MNTKKTKTSRKYSYRFRNSLTGRYTTREWAQRHQGLTVRERVRLPEAEL